MSETHTSANRRFELGIVGFFIFMPPIGGLVALYQALQDTTKFGQSVGLLAWLCLLIGAHIKFVRPFFRRYPIVRGYKEIAEKIRSYNGRHAKLTAGLWRSRILRSAYRIGFFALTLPFFVGQYMIYGHHFVWFTMGWVVAGFGITVGYHRIGTHPSFKCPEWVRAVLLVMGSMAVQGPVSEWTKKHSKHHAFGETSADVHSPYVFEDSKRGIFIEQFYAFMHSFMMWAFREPSLRRPKGMSIEDWKTDLLANHPEPATFKFREEDRGHWEVKDKSGKIVASTEKLIKARWGRFVDVIVGIERDKTIAILGQPLVYLSILAVSVGAPMVLGGISIWEVLARICYVNWATFCVNSVSHIWGEQPFQVPDNSRNNAVVEILALGEGGHNTHHKSELWAQHGVFAWQFDPSAMLIKTLAFFGLARELNLPSRAQIRAAWRGWRRREPTMQGYLAPTWEREISTALVEQISAPEEAIA